MNAAANLESLVRAADYDRYMSALFAPVTARPHLMALYAFNFEVAKTAETVSQPMAGLIRLQWWRDAVAEIYTGKTLEHEVVQALSRAILAHDLPRDLFDAMIDAREADLEETPFTDMTALETYADATSAGVMRLAARILGADDRCDMAAREAGIAYALTGLLRALPYHAAKRRIMLPMDMLHAAEVSPDHVFAGKASAKLSALIAKIAEAARAHYAAAAVRSIPRRMLPAFLPATLVPAYLRVLTRPGIDPLRNVPDISLARRQFMMLRAMIRGRI